MISTRRTRWILALLVPGLAILLTGIVLVFSGETPERVDYDLARGRALLDGGNLLGALEIIDSAADANPDHVGARTLLGIVRLRMYLYQSAIAEFERATELDSDLAAPWIGLGHAYLALGRIGDAIAASRRATELDAAAQEAWIVLAQARWLDRSYADAEAAALEARNLDAANPEALEALLHIYMDQEEPEKFEALMDEVPDGHRSLNALILSFLVRQGEFRRAWEYRTRSGRRENQLAVLEAELALARNPDQGPLIPQLVRSLVATGRFEDAIGYGRAYGGIEPMNFEMGKAFWLAGDLQNAVRRFEAASRRGIHKLSAEVALAIMTGELEHWHKAFRAEHPEEDYLVLGQLEDVSRSAPKNVEPLIWRYLGIYEPIFYNRAVEVGIQLDEPDASDLNILLTMGTAYERLGRFDEAVRYFERARDAYPSSSEPPARLAMVVIRRGDVAGVVDLMEQAVSLDETHSGHLFNLGWLHDEMGEDDRAATFYSRSIEASPLSFEAMNNLALIYGNRGQHEEARELLELAIRTDPTSETAYYNLARYYGNRSEWRAALGTYDRVLRINPFNSTALVEQGRIELRLGKLETAVERLNSAVGLDSQLFEGDMLVSSAYERLGFADVALAAVEEARRIRSDDPGLASTLARLQEGN